MKIHQQARQSPLFADRLIRLFKIDLYKLKHSILNKAEEIFGLDLRSLALFRIGLGLLIIIDLAYRYPDLVAHYTDFGLLPRAPLIEEFLNRWFWSIHLMSGEAIIQRLMFGISAILALMLIAGFKTRFATVASWIMLVSLQNRNLMIINGGDTEFRLLLFWAMFLPLGAYFSADRALQTRPSPAKRIQAFHSPFPPRVLSVATLAITFQICSIYWFSWALKTDPMWRETGEAVYYALSIDHFATPFAHFLLKFPSLLPILTFSTLWIEGLGPFLLFIPYRTSWFRCLAVILFVLLHLGFRAGLAIGLFPWISATAWLIFIPSQFWHYLGERHNFQSIRSGLWESNSFGINHAIKRAKELRSRNPFKIRGNFFNFRNFLISQLLALSFLICISYENLASLENLKIRIPEIVQVTNLNLRLDQRWDMFAPYPMIDDGWYVIPGILKDGTEVDLFRQGQPVTWKKPALISKMYANDHWRKYMVNIWLRDNAPYRLYYGQYLCRDWNSRHRQMKLLDRFKIYYMLEKTLPNYQKPGIEPVLLWEHYCFQIPEAE